MRIILTIALSAPMFCVPALAETVPEAPKVYLETPAGKGDPNAISCRAPQAMTGTLTRGPAACALNSVLALYRKAGMDVAADGIHAVYKSGGRMAPVLLSDGTARAMTNFQTGR